MKVVGGVDGISFVHFDDRDVVSHPLVQQIVKAYEWSQVDPDSKRPARLGVPMETGRAVRDGSLARWLAAIAPPRAAGDVGVALVSDARMRALNRKYRRTDKATDVLAFSADGFFADSASAFLSARGAPLLLMRSGPHQRCRSRVALTAAQGCRSLSRGDFRLREASADRRSLGGGRSRRARAAGAPRVSIVGDIVIAAGVARRRRKRPGIRIRPSCGSWRCMGCCTFWATTTTIAVTAAAWRAWS